MKLTISILAILTFCINAYSQVPNYVPTNGLVGWWPFNGNANDESGHGNNGTVIGATLITDRNGQQAYKFDGINDIININSKVGNFGANDFSVSLWVYDEDTQNSGTLVGKRNDDANMLNLVWSNSPGLELGSPYVLITPKGSMLNEWKNCVLIRKGTNISIYINGVLEQKNISSMTPNINNSANLSFGARYYYSQTGQHFKGSIDDIGIWNRALSEEEIRILYSLEKVAQNQLSQVPNYVPTSGLVGWWPFNGNANDESGHGNNGTVIGATLITDRNGQQAYKFDGINDIININSKVGNFGANDFSVSLWVYDEDTQNSGTLVGKRNDDANMLNLVWSNSPGLELGSPYVLITPKGSMLNEWKNCVLIRKGTNISIYINGVLEQKNGSSMTPNINNSANLSFGARYYYSQTGEHFKGSIDDIGIWNRALTEGEIKGLYSFEQLTQTKLSPEQYYKMVYEGENDNPYSSFEDYLASTKKEKEPELITNSSNSNHTAGENNQFNIPKNSNEFYAKLDMIYDTIQKIAYLNELISNLKNNSDQSTEWEMVLNQLAHQNKLNYIIPNKYDDPSISQAEWYSLYDYLISLGDNPYDNVKHKIMTGVFLYWSILVRQKLGESYIDIKWHKMVVNKFAQDDFPMGKKFYNECKNIVDGTNNLSDSKNTKITNSNNQYSTSCTYNFVKPNNLTYKYIDNRKYCCYCPSNFASYSLVSNTVNSEQAIYLAEKLYLHFQSVGADKEHKDQDFSRYKDFMKVSYPGFENLLLGMVAELSMPMFPLYVLAGKTLGSTVREINKYKVEGNFCSPKCKDDCSYSSGCKCD